MSFIKKITQIPNEFLYNIGKRSYGEYFIKQLAKQDQPKARKYLESLYDMKIASDPQLFFKKMQEFGSFVEDCKMRSSGLDVKKTYLYPAADQAFGSRPQGSRIWSFFANPWAVFAYFNEQYWAVGRCLDLVRETILSDGFALKGAEGLSEEKLIEYYKILDKLNINELWTEYIIHMMLYGNFFALPHYGKRSRKVVKYEILYPPRIYPIVSQINDKTEGYEYRIGRIKRYYSVDEVDHSQTPSMQGKDIGPPPLLSCTTEIETALMTMNFNNDAMQKGALLGKIISLEAPVGDGMTSSVNDSWVQEVQAHFDHLRSGSKAGQGYAVAAGVKDVFDVSKIGEVELNFRESRPELDKRICNRLGIPSEKIGIPRSTTAQYQPSLVENVVNAQFDATINSYTVQAANFLNKYLLQEGLGIYDAKLVPAGRYGAITLAAAQTTKELAAAGPIITVNEARTNILGWAPLPANDSRGQWVLDNSMNRDPEARAAMIAPDVIDPELELEKMVGKIQEGKNLFIKFGGSNAGEISKSAPTIIRPFYSEEAA